MANEMPRIALVVPNLPLGGGVPAVARFVRQALLNSGQFQLKLVSLTSSRDDAASMRLLQPKSWWRGPVVDERQWEGIAVHHVGARLGELEPMRYQSRQILSALLADCDLIQVVCGSPAWANPVLGLGKPVSVQCATLAKVERRRRDHLPAGLTGHFRKAMTIATDYYDQRALRLVDAIQVENPWMLDHCQTLNAGRTVDLRYAPPGVDADLFTPKPERLQTAEPYILCVARLDDPRKNIELLLQAYAKLPAQIIAKVRLCLAGSSGPPLAFWKRAEMLGLRERITYVQKPDMAELVALYQGARAFALCSDEEGLGVVILEAMACGVPVVSTRSGGPDGIICDGVDGYLTPLDDADAMAARLQILLQDDALNTGMGIAARATIEARYADAVAGAAFVDTWQKLLVKVGR